MDNVFRVQIRKVEDLLKERSPKMMKIVKRLDNQPEWEEILDGVVQPGGS